MTNQLQTETEADEIICDCTGTTRAKIQQLINDGADCIDHIADATGACTGCGSCDILVMEIIENEAK